MLFTQITYLYVLVNVCTYTRKYMNACGRLDGRFALCEGCGQKRSTIPFHGTVSAFSASVFPEANYSFSFCQLQSLLCSPQPDKLWLVIGTTSSGVRRRTPIHGKEWQNLVQISSLKPCVYYKPCWLKGSLCRRDRSVAGFVAGGQRGKYGDYCVSLWFLIHC